VVGGSGKGLLTGRSDLYYYADGDQWALSQPMVDGRADSAMAELPNGQVVIAGGLSTDGSSSASVQVYSSVSGLATERDPMPYGLAGLTATTLKDGSVLLVGGASTQTTVVGLAELYRPTP
jgi:hypothetical protein